MRNRSYWKQSLVVAFVVLVTGSVAAQGQFTDEQVRQRQRISTMEGVLERAVNNGADRLLRQMSTVLPDAAMLTGLPRVRGFRLDGHGVFFDVEVPGLQLSVAWPLRAMINDTRAMSALVSELRLQIEQGSSRERERLEPLVRRIEMMLPPAAMRAAANARGGATVSATALAPGAAGSAIPPPVAPVEPDVLSNPDASWTRAVKTALIEAMLEYGGSLEVAPDEWLIVGASDNVPRDPLVPGGTVDFSTVIFRVKGSDLADFHGRRLTLEEATKKVEVREY